ncbi:MAG: helix-turn-helix transcriptional regulator [Clostridia bacterium]|nr:helix-turn-helix transcriptional regulator [Clostridia bacterium]
MKEDFGTRLKDLRLEKNLGQVAFAKQIGVGKSIISAWETNKSEPTLSNLIKIANFFNTTIDYLAGLEK